MVVGPSGPVGPRVAGGHVFMKTTPRGTESACSQSHSTEGSPVRGGTVTGDPVNTITCANVRLSHYVVKRLRLSLH